MRNKRIYTVIAALLVCLLVGCGHTHQWQEATCEKPKTCADCGETEGNALDHSWQEATCEAPETCRQCGEIRGEALRGHSWINATCEAPAICSVCGETFGSPSHTFTIVCGEPKTCTLCGYTEGGSVEHYKSFNYKLRENDYSCTCGACGEVVTVQVEDWNAAAEELLSRDWRCVAIMDTITGSVSGVSEEEMKQSSLTFDMETGTARLITEEIDWNGSYTYTGTGNQADGSLYLMFEAVWQGETLGVVLEGGYRSMNLGVIDYPDLCLYFQIGDSVLFWS